MTGSALDHRRRKRAGGRSGLNAIGHTMGPDCVALLSFEGPRLPDRSVSSLRHNPPREATAEYSPPRRAPAGRLQINPEARGRLHGFQALEAALPDAQNGPVELRCRQVELGALEDAVVEPHSPLLDQPPPLAAAEAEVIGEQSRQVDAPVPLDLRHLDVLG